MKTILALLLTSCLCFYSQASVVVPNSLLNNESPHDLTEKDDLLKKLSEFLVAANSFVAETAASGNITESEFRSWTGRKFESVRAFREMSKMLQKELENVAKEIGVDINRLNGVNATLNHILGDKDQRLSQIATSLKDKSLEACYKDYISAHQSCLATAILEGLFEYQDWVSGANLINCLSSAVKTFDECGNPQ